MLARAYGPHPGVPRKTPVHGAEEAHPFEPPVTEELGVEGCGDHASVPGRSEQVRKVGGLLLDPMRRVSRLVRPFPAEINVGSAHPPELEAARPADLVEFEIGFIARVAMLSAPDLHRSPRIAHEHRDSRPAARRDPIRPIGRAHRGGQRPCDGIVAFAIESLRAEGHLGVVAERGTRLGEMRVCEEVPEPCIG